MKRACFIFVLLAKLSISADCQVVSSCIPSASLRQEYGFDVADLALERTYQLKSADTALIEIPQRYQDTIFSALAAVCNIGQQFEADSALRYYCVHRWPRNPFIYPVLRVQVDTNYAWAKQWYLGNTVTGNAAIDHC